MIKLQTTGNFSKTETFLQRAKASLERNVIEQYALEGLNALQKATPVETGLTANSWECKIEETENNVTLSYWNTNVNDGVPIAIILQYGHATGTGGWVEGTDYINPAIKPIFDKIATNVWKEVTK